MNEKIEYPKFLYHKTKEPVIVQSKEEHEELGKSWHEKPVAKQETKTQDLEQNHDG